MKQQDIILNNLRTLAVHYPTEVNRLYMAELLSKIKVKLNLDFIDSELILNTIEYLSLTFLTEAFSAAAYLNTNPTETIPRAMASFDAFYIVMPALLQLYSHRHFGTLGPEAVKKSIISIISGGAIFGAFFYGFGWLVEKHTKGHDITETFFSSAFLGAGIVASADAAGKISTRFLDRLFHCSPTSYEPIIATEEQAAIQAFKGYEVGRVRFEMLFFHIFTIINVFLNLMPNGNNYLRLAGLEEPFKSGNIIFNISAFVGFLLNKLWVYMNYKMRIGGIQ
jgi:hypothetical protein